jgi:hypothetical protein
MCIDGLLQINSDKGCAVMASSKYTKDQGCALMVSSRSTQIRDEHA